MVVALRDAQANLGGVVASINVQLRAVVMGCVQLHGTNLRNGKGPGRAPSRAFAVPQEALRELEFDAASGPAIAPCSAFVSWRISFERRRSSWFC